MSFSQFPKSPNKIDPVIPSAVASRTSLVWEGRSKPAESKKIIDEAARYISEYTKIKLPPEITKDLDVMASLEDKIYNYVNQAYVNMFNRYAVTVEDEMVKKVRDFVDKEELKSLARYTPREITEILDKVGGAEKFNTGEIEKSVVNMYGHLQGHVQRGVYDLEVETNALLRQKQDVGSFVRGENAYAIVKCAFKDSRSKPKTVTDIKLSVNILDSELISPIFHYQVTVEHLLKEQLASHITFLIDREIEKLKEDLLDAGKQEMSSGEVMFEQIKTTEKFTDDNVSDPNSRRYTILSKKFIDRIEGLRAEIDQDEYDPLNLREQIKAIIDSENIRNRGFNTAVNTITSILDSSKLGYQFCDNKKNAREAIIREYEDENDEQLPDERYQLRLVYYDQNQIRDLKRIYDQRMGAFLREVQIVWDVVEELTDRSKKRGFGLLPRRITDFEDLCMSIMPAQWRKERKELHEDEDELHWLKLQFRDQASTFVEKNNRTYSTEMKNTGDMILHMRKQLQKIFGYRNPLERVLVDERLMYLDKEFNDFTYEVNPHHLQPGVLLDVDMTTTKRKQYMMKAMANVLNEFLFGISQGFADAAFATFSRRRSTTRTNEEFAFAEKVEGETTTSSAYEERFATSKTTTMSGSSSGSEMGASSSSSADVTPKSFEGGNSGAAGLQSL